MNTLLTAVAAHLSAAGLPAPVVWENRDTPAPELPRYEARLGPMTSAVAAYSGLSLRTLSLEITARAPAQAGLSAAVALITALMAACPAGLRLGGYTLAQAPALAPPMADGARRLSLTFQTYS